MTLRLSHFWMNEDTVRSFAILTIFASCSAFVRMKAVSALITCGCYLSTHISRARFFGMKEDTFFSVALQTKFAWCLLHVLEHSIRFLSFGVSVEAIVTPRAFVEQIAEA